mmetsp:Transcript_12612/g.36714  ORF Transcript_12612/g.36714 Transcript_12612/m.36714 type:complete len:203 (-) Transcript_12612:944-1552(-)
MFVSFSCSQYVFRLHILGNEFFMMLLNLLDDTLHLFFGWQEGGTEPVSSLFLSKSGCRNDAYPSLLQQRHAVHGIRCHALSLRFFNGLGWDLDGWEAVHGTLCWLTRETVNIVQSVTHDLGTTFQALKDGRLFGFMAFVRFVTGFRTAHHETRHDLTGHGGAQTGRCQFVQLIMHAFVDAGEFHVPATASAFTKDALGRGME